MSQDIFSSIDPAMSGTTLATTLNAFKDAIVSGCSGTSRPPNLQIGGSWVDTTNNPTSWTYRIWTGTDDVGIFTINLTTGVAGVSLAVDSFIVKKISADTVGAIMELVKRRIATNGQVLSGDVVGEIQMIGRTSTAGNPVVGKIIWTATDDQTTSAYGGTLSFHSTPDGTATLTEHMRFINGLLETIVPHKMNSQVLVSQDVATAATIAQLSASKVVVEMTGSTTTSIQGVNAAHDSKLVTIHNRSTAVVTLKHEDAGATAVDRLKLPSSSDIQIIAQGSVTLFYCTTDSRWKIVSTSEKSNGLTIDTLYGRYNSWSAPSVDTNIRVTTFRSIRGGATEYSGMIDNYGNAYAWGLNTNGQLGVGDVTPRSSPVAVLGGFQFERNYGATVSTTVMSRYGLATTGAAYAWGINANGQLGDASVVPKSSPVAVAGGFRFTELFQRDSMVLGLTTNALAYGWGINTNGQLGTGNVTPVSSPVAVLRGFQYSKLVPISGAAGAAAVLGLDASGIAYAWGINTQGNLGLGDVTPRSSPVAVLGGFTFQNIYGLAASANYASFGLTTAGALYAWGSGSGIGTLGVGDNNPRSSPVAVVGGLTFRRLFIHPKTLHVMGLATDGAIYAWGQNNSGQLGVGDTTARSSPVAVIGGITFTRIRMLATTTWGLTSDGTLYAWGANANGQLGVGDTTPRSSPVAVLGGFKFADVFIADGPTDQASVLGITQDGLMYAWGSNTNGTLGVGDVTPRSSPVAVVGAFAPDAGESTRTLDLTATGGSSYTVTTGPGSCRFGSVPLGRDIYKIEVEYLS